MASKNSSDRSDGRTGATKTKFDRYLDEQLRDPDFASRFTEAGKAWDVALQLTRMREDAAKKGDCTKRPKRDGTVPLFRGVSGPHSNK